MHEKRVPETMRVALLRGREDMIIREIAVPEVPVGGAIIKAKSVGICGSDVIKVRNTISTEERVIGHEIAGEIVSLYPDADLPVGIGDRVVVGHVHVPCMHCHYCQHGSFAMCRAFKRSNILPGGFAEYIAVSADHLKHTVMRIPSSLSYDEATFVDPVACCLHAIERVHVQAPMKAVVIGCGTMGAIFIQILGKLEVDVTAIDISDARLKMAERFGASRGLNPDSTDLVPELQALTQGIGFDVIFLTVVNQEILDQACSLVRDGGSLSLFAGPVEHATLNIDFYAFFRRELSLVSSYSASMANMGAALDWIMSGRLNLEDMITGFCDLENILPSMLSFDDTTYKVIVHP
jgi:L-iditol 2-dehydrogenase